ncbi:MAG: exo-alpha-sialidase [Acidobacteriota bacterium]
MKVRHVKVQSGDVVLLVGTMKGLFLLRSDPKRSSWSVGGPYFPGHSVYALAYDSRGGRQRLWVGAHSLHWGAVLHYSDDFGRIWSPPEQVDLKFPQDTGLSLKQIWQLVPGGSQEPDRLYCGVEPASLFTTDDAGRSWSLVRGLHDHPHRPRWEPGGGGLCLHTILPDPGNARRISVGISTGGMYRSDDGGATWKARNSGIRADFLPDKQPEFGQCVHKIVHHPSRPERLFLQNHGGLYRSDNAGDTWQDIGRGVPSDFGFAMLAHPHQPDTIYVVPLESDQFRCTPDRKLRVYRSQNAGRSWEPLFRGLPQRNAMETVLRDSLTADSLQPAGIYFGTRSGFIYGSAEGGERWKVVLRGLPPVVCVKGVAVAELSR